MTASTGKSGAGKRVQLSMNTSSSRDPFVELKSHEMSAIHGLVAGIRIYFLITKRGRVRPGLLGGVVLLTFDSEKCTKAPSVEHQISPRNKLLRGRYLADSSTSSASQLIRDALRVSPAKY